MKNIGDVRDYISKSCHCGDDMAPTTTMTRAGHFILENVEQKNIPAL